ncbi:MAG: hypothetical protein RIC35_03780 [Marinoscillum sp.]
MTQISRIYISIVFLLICSLASAQNEIVNLSGPKFLSLSSQLPEDLTRERVIVVISVPSKQSGRFEIRGNWKDLAQKSHKFFRQIGVDPVGYIYQDDINAGPEVKSAYLELLSSRQVKNIVMVEQSGSATEVNYTLTVTPFAPEGFVTNGQLGWRDTHEELERVMIRLGRQVLRQELTRSNLLIPEFPEYLNDLVVFKGNRLENYPSRLASLKLAVVKFQEVKISSEMNQALIDQVNAYNLEVAEKNKRIVEIMSQYPFQYDLVDASDEDQLYKMGYQYALMPLSSTGRSIKRILNYQSLKTETHYVSSRFDAQGNGLLERIPVDANATKYYIKQTIVKDVHTGEWDADATWDLAMHNFVYNLRKAFRR